MKKTTPARSQTLKPRLRKIRRIVTGHDARGRSVIVSDASSPHVMTLRGIPTFGVTEIWTTDSISMGRSGAQAVAHDASASRHPMMHRTQTVDYAIVLSGEIWALMDSDETKMKAGDILVQRGTNHAWSNRSNKPCLVAFVLIDAKPLKQI